MTRYEPQKKRKKDSDLHLDRDSAKRGSSYSKSGLRVDNEITPKRKKQDDIYKEDIYEEDIFEDADRREKKKMPKGLKAVIIIVIILLVLAGGLYFAMNSLMQPAKRIKLDNNDLGITRNTTAASDIDKVVLFGIDGDESYSGGRSDTIMIAAINKKSKTIKLISILRDTKVDLEGYGPNKINAAYAYGGPELALKTLNQNFNQDLKQFVTVDFSRLSDIVDMVDGVDITITADEAGQINSFCPYEMPVGEGLAHLNGPQAVAYSRIRNLDSDYYRVGRQHNVLNAIFASFRNMSITQYPGFIKNLMNTIETSMGFSDVLSFALAYRDYSMESYTVPDPDYEENLWGGIDENGMWVWVYDLNAAANRIQSIMDDEFETVPATQEGE